MHIPCVPIVLVDDGPRSIKSELRHYTGIPWSRLAIKEMPYDSGLAAGRNLLIHTISTDFLVYFDDDFQVTHATNIQKMVATFDVLPSVMIVGGIVSDRKDFGFRFKVEGQILQQQPRTPLAEPEGCSMADIVPNFFAARVDELRAIGWDDSFKLGEHEDFFFRAQQAGHKSIVCNFSEVKHVSDTSWQITARSVYEKRRQRAWDYQQKFLNKHGLLKYVTQSNQLLVSNEDFFRAARNAQSGLYEGELESWLDEHSLSVILLAWKRRDNIVKLLKELSSDKELINEVVVWNNYHMPLVLDSEYGLKVRVYDSDVNINTLGRWKACAQIAKGPLCFFIDDDFYPTMLRQLLFSYQQKPEVLHSTTNVRVAWNNRRWAIEDSETGIHTSFAWLGSGAIVSQSSARLFLTRLEMIAEIDLDVCDNMYAYLMNQHPILMLTELETDGLSMENPYSRGEIVLRRLAESRRRAISALREHATDWFKDETLGLSVPPAQAIARSGNFYVVTNAVTAIPMADANLDGRQRFTDVYINNIDEAGEFRRSFRDAVDHSALAAVDGQLETYWKSTLIKRGMFIMIDLMRIVEMSRVEIVATSDFFQFMTHLSCDGVEWDEYNFQNRISCVSSDNYSNVRSCTIELSGFIARFVKFSADWDFDKVVQVWELLPEVRLKS